jgi:hypothetical protein
MVTVTILCTCMCPVIQHMVTSPTDKVILAMHLLAILLNLPHMWLHFFTVYEFYSGNLIILISHIFQISQNVSH